MADGGRKVAGQGVVCIMAFCGTEEEDLTRDEDDSDDEGTMSLGGGSAEAGGRPSHPSRNRRMLNTNDWPVHEQRAVDFARGGGVHASAQSHESHPRRGYHRQTLAGSSAPRGKLLL